MVAWGFVLRRNGRLFLRPLQFHVASVCSCGEKVVGSSQPAALPCTAHALLRGLTDATTAFLMVTDEPNCLARGLLVSSKYVGIRFGRLESQLPKYLVAHSILRDRGRCMGMVSGKRSGSQPSGRDRLGASHH